MVIRHRLCPQVQHIKGPVASPLSQHLGLSVVLNLSILLGGQ